MSLFFPLQATSADGSATIFNIDDCPKLIDDEFFYLSNRAGTPLLRKETILRGSDVFLSDGRRIFEGDILRSLDEGIHFVLFHNGFKLRGQDGCMRLLNCQHPFTYLGSWVNLRNEIEMPQWLDSHFQSPKHRKVRYMDLPRGIVFNLFDLISASGENALIYKDGGTIVAFRDIGQFSGIKQPSGKGYYYGQHINGVGNVTIRAGIPGIMTAAGFRSFGDAEFRKKLV